MSTGMTVATFVAAALAIVFVPFVVMAGAGWWKRDRNPLTHRTLLALLLSLAFAFAAAVALGSSSAGRQTFENFGLAKFVTLPVVFVLFFVVLLFPFKGGVRFRKPAWWMLLFGIVVASTLVEIIVPRRTVDLLDLAKSVALTGGLLVAAAAGMRAAVWSERDVIVFVCAVGGVALASQILLSLIHI